MHGATIKIAFIDRLFIGLIKKTIWIV